jgi:hypothetical protein
LLVLLRAAQGTPQEQALHKIGCLGHDTRL